MFIPYLGKWSNLIFTCFQGVESVPPTSRFFHPFCSFWLPPGVVNIFATIPGLFLVDRCGRSKLMKWSAIGALAEKDERWNVTFLWEIFGGCWVKTSEISPVNLLENPDKKLKLRNDVLLSCAGNRWRYMLSGKLETLFKEAIRRIGTDVDGQKVDKCDSMFQPLCFSFGVSYFWTFSTLHWTCCGFVVPVHIAFCL